MVAVVTVTRNRRGVCAYGVVDEVGDQAFGQAGVAEDGAVSREVFEVEAAACTTSWSRAPRSRR